MTWDDDCHGPLGDPREAAMEREYEKYMDAKYMEYLEAQEHAHFMATDPLYAARHERDTYAETLRVLLLGRAQAYGFQATGEHYRDWEARRDVERGAARSYDQRHRTRAGECHAMAAIALIIALMIGGER